MLTPGPDFESMLSTDKKIVDTDSPSFRTQYPFFQAFTVHFYSALEQISKTFGFLMSSAGSSKSQALNQSFMRSSERHTAMPVYNVSPTCERLKYQYQVFLLISILLASQQCMQENFCLFHFYLLFAKLSNLRQGESFFIIRFE